MMRNCPKCGHDNSQGAPLKCSWQDWVLKQCACCYFVYLENPPTYECLAAEHPWEMNHGERKERIRAEYPIAFATSKAWRVLRRRLFPKSDKLMRRVSRWFPPGPVADIGCGDGGHLLRLPDRFEPIGVELSETLARRSRARLAHRQVTILNMSALEGLGRIPDNSLSGVIMRSFLEHEARPAELLDLTARTLRTGGAVIIKVPNYACLNRRVMGPRWCGFHFPGHVNYFSPSSLRDMVECAGLQVVSFNLLDHFVLSDNMWLVARRRGRTETSKFQPT